MCSRILSVVLATIIVGCPALCGSACAQPTTSKKVRARCACCCHTQSRHTPSRHDSPSEKAPQHNCDHSCQCICGGAIVDLASQFSAGDDLGWTTPLPTADVHLPSALARLVAVSPDSLQPDDGANPGRTLRCLLSTFLC
jgi:hypothetical protein